MLSIFIYHEISGKKSYITLACGFVITALGVACITISKAF